MFNSTALMIEAFVKELHDAYRQTYSSLEPQFANVIEWTGRLALENIANSDALYHNLEHTILVTLVGQTILKGKHLSKGGVSPRDWLHVVMALLCHDIGYVKGICNADKHGEYATGIKNETVKISEDGTDASLTPYHVDRSKLFVRERFGKHKLTKEVDAEIIATYIERTRFPVPKDDEYQQSGDYAGLVRAADFIGQLGDPNYLRKVPALFYEFTETGTNEKTGYTSPGHMRSSFTKFYWDIIFPYLPDALRFLNVTQEGKLWVANLYAHVHVVEHNLRENGIA
jgi:hypothetical protein